MTSLRIVRGSNYADKCRVYWIALDGNKIGKVKNGEAKELAISSGRHDLSIRLDWCGSKTLPFTSSEGEVVTFRVTTNLRGVRIFLALWYVLFARNSYLVLEQVI
jgi:hypothetical protein